MANAKTPAATGFVPFVPPCIKRIDDRGGSGPITPSTSLLHRMDKREVDEEVVAMVAWTLSYFSARPHYSSCWDMTKAEKKVKSSAALTERIEKELLDDLGLEWKEGRMGGLSLEVKEEFQGGNPDLPLWEVSSKKKAHSPIFLGTVRAASDIDAVQRYATWAKISAVGLSANLQHKASA